jgi:hypothetical protein
VDRLRRKRFVCPEDDNGDADANYTGDDTNHADDDTDHTDDDTDPANHDTNSATYYTATHYTADHHTADHHTAGHRRRNGRHPSAGNRAVDLHAGRRVRHELAWVGFGDD